MASCVPWSFTDEEGLNPLNKPGEFDFNVWYEVEYPEPDARAYYGPGLDITAVTCTQVHFDDERTRRRRPAENELQELSDWFYSYIDSHPDEYAAIKDRAFEYSFVDPEND